MTRIMVVNRNRAVSNSLILGGFVFALCLSSLSVSAQQSQPSDTQATIEQQQASQAPETANQSPPSQAVPPDALTLPAGTVIRVRVDEWLSSDRNLPGDAFSAVLDQPIVVDGWVVARRGQSETGRVSVAKKAGHGSDTSQLGLQLSNLTLVDGQQLPLQTQMVQTSAGGPSHGQSAAVVGTTMGVGAAIGAAADGGPGAAIGAGVGAVAGMIGVESTRGRPTVIPPETVLSFQLQTPVTISTAQSQFAFQPVTQEDYDSRTANGRPQHFEGPGGQGYPPPPPYYGYPYAYPYAYAYPYPYAYFPGPFAFGFYGGYGFGPRFGGFRGGFRR